MSVSEERGQDKEGGEEDQELRDMEVLWNGCEGRKSENAIKRTIISVKCDKKEKKKHQHTQNNILYQQISQSAYLQRHQRRAQRLGPLVRVLFPQ